MQTFFLAGTVAYFLVAIIAFVQKEVKDDDKEDEDKTLQLQLALLV
jgi:hypothetical protein